MFATFITSFRDDRPKSSLGNIVMFWSKKFGSKLLLGTVWLLQSGRGWFETKTIRNLQSCAAQSLILDSSGQTSNDSRVLAWIVPSSGLDGQPLGENPCCASPTPVQCYTTSAIIPLPLQCYGSSVLFWPFSSSATLAWLAGQMGPLLPWRASPPQSDLGLYFTRGFK